MSVEGRNIDWAVPFGPVIMETTISDELHSTLLNRADQLREGTHPNPDINTETNDYRTRLAGCLSEEYSYEGAFTKEEAKMIEDEFCYLAAHYTLTAHKAGKLKKRFSVIIFQINCLRTMPKTNANK